MEKQKEGKGEGNKRGHQRARQTSSSPSSVSRHVIKLSDLFPGKFFLYVWHDGRFRKEMGTDTYAEFTTHCARP